jgi:hypothetical protein
MELPPCAEVVPIPVALQNPLKVAEEVLKVLTALFGVNVEISVPIISTACSFDAIKLRVGRSVVSDVAHVFTKFQLDRSRKSAVPRFYKVVPTNYGEDQRG